MRNAFVIAWKEWKTFFQTPVGYVILTLFTALAGFFFFAVSGFFVQREATIRGLLTWVPWLFFVFAPAITMKLWAEEKRAGTIETLLTLPLKDWEIVVGKFLAAVGLVAAYLVCLLPIVGVVAWFGEPDPGPIVGGLIGALLLGSAYVAIGVAASALTENQIISLIVGVIFSFVFWLIGWERFVGIFPDALSSFLYNLSLNTHFESISRGVLDSRDLLYYGTFIAFFLVVNTWAVRRKSRGGVTILLSAGILILANYLAQSHFFRIDLTANNRYTLAEDTKKVLGNLGDDLRLTAYLSSDVPAEFSNIRRDIADTVHEFESFAGGHLRVEIVDPDESEQGKKAAEAAGFQAAPLGGGDTDKLTVKNAYLAIAVEYGDKTEKLPFVASTDTLEYDLIRRIAKITRKGPVKIAFQVSDPMAGMNMPGMPRPPSSDKHTPQTDLRMIDGLLKEEYETTTVDLKSKVPDDVKTVIVANVEGLTEVSKFWLDQFLMRGGGLILMADGSAEQSFGGMGGGSPFMRSANDKLPDDFLSHYGLKINKDIVLDLRCAPINRPVELAPGIRMSRPINYPPFPIALRDTLDQKHPITTGFPKLVFPFCSSITLDPKPGVQQFDLVKSSPTAKNQENFMMLSPDTFDQLNPDEYKSQYLLAGLLEGDFQSYYVAHEVPREVIDGGNGEEGGMDGEPKGADAGFPFGLGDEDEAHAKSKEDEVPAATPPAKADGTTPDKPASDGDGAPPPPSGDPKDDGKKDGGPRAPAQEGDAQDVPGGGVVHAQDPAPAVPTPAPADAAPTAPKKEFEYLKKSTARARIFAVGTTEFAVDDTVKYFNENAFLLQNVANYMASENLSGLRSKRLDDASFADVADGQKTAAKLLGWWATPVSLFGLGLFVHFWRRHIRPANARRRMAAVAAN